ncbi:MAG: SGNH/GDSL hydrolase family protein [Elusimicrobia bacterium]|nr:SGNH/GDSL hydrolase family protein [Elusimicrobiota bacterium]
MKNISKKRAFLSIVGILFALILLELGLRLGGFVHLSILRSKNQAAIKEKGTYRILCLGDSTTENQWPPYLKEILNKEDLGIKFSVIDKGRSCTNTMHIMAELEQNISEYKPDMVITMMGVNDGGYYSDITNIRPGTLKNLRIYKLFKMIFLSIKDKNKEVQAAPIESIKQDENILEISWEKEARNNTKKNSLTSDELYAKLQQSKSGSADEYISMRRNYRDQGKY